MTIIPDTKKARLACALAVILACAAAYHNTLACGFVADDHELLAGNPWVRDFSHVREIFTSGIWAEHGKPLNYYRPLVHLFFLFGYQLFWPEPWGFHLVNLLFHAGVSLLVFAVTLRLVRTHRPGGPALLPALVAAVLFATHPVHTESVAWISGITDLSCSLFYLLSFYLYISYRSGARRRYLAASAASFFLAALCKEAALTLPVLILAHDLLLAPARPGLLKRALHDYAPYAAAAGIYLVLRNHALGGFAPELSHERLGAYRYALNVAELFGGYVAKLVMPVNLNAYYVFHPARSALEPGVFAGATILAASAAAVFLLRRDRLALFGSALFAVPLLPVFYIYGLGDSAFAERYLYLAVFGFTFLAALAVGRLPSGTKPAHAALGMVAAVAALYAVLAVERNRAWVSDDALWTAALETAQATGLPSYDVGVIQAKLGRMDEAVRSLEAAVMEMPDYVKAHNNLAAAYASLGMFDKAIREGRATVALDPGHVKAYYNLGMDLYSNGDVDEAEGAFRKALELRPGFPEAHLGLGIVFMRKGLLGEAVAELSLAVKLNPGNADARKMLEQAAMMKEGR